MNVLFVQPALPHYRVPFFAELQRRSSGQLEVWSDHTHPLLPHVDPGGRFGTRHCPERRLGPFLSQPALHEAVRSDADVVVLSWNSRYLQLPSATLEARLRGRAVVLWGHGYSKHPSAWRHQLRNALGRVSHACVTYSEPVRKRLISEGLDARCVFAAPNALDGAPLIREREYWGSRPEELADLQRRFGLVAGKVFVFVSRLEGDKRVQLLLDAFARVVPQVSGAQLLIVGDGSQRQSLEERCRALGIAEQTRFVGAIYDERVLGGLLSSCDVFVYPVAVGLSILHALHYALPVITSNDETCHNPEFDVLVPGQNSLLYEHDHVADLAAQMVRAMTDRDLRRRLSHGALASVSGPGGRTLESMVGGMWAALQFAVSQSRRRHP